MEKLEYITANAMMQCSNGSAPGIFTPTYNQTIKINRCKVATKADIIPFTNIPSFVVCKKTRKCCTPIPTEWTETYPVQVKGQQTLIGQSCMKCGIGGKIEFLSSGQVPLTSEEENELHKIRKDTQEAFEEEQEEENKPWWQKAGEFAIDMMPVVGPVVSLVKNVSKGNWKMAALDVVFLGMDVVSLVATPFTGGASLAGAAAAKAAIRGVIKAGEEKLAKKVSKETIEVGAKKTTELLSKLSVRNLTGGRLCVFACFLAGTPVATKDGLRNIEDIRRGDEVWAYDENTGEIGLKPVINHFERQANILVSIEVDGETIYTTPEHPFYANGEWKEAGLLETGDAVLLFTGRLAKVNKVKYEETHALVEKSSDVFSDIIVGGDKLQIVYNFEVEGWHTYFVGWLKVLVHNICLKEALQNGEKWAVNIIRGIAYNNKINKEMLELASEKGLKYYSETWLKEGKKLFARVDGYISGKAIIERKATNLSKVSVAKAKSYIDQLALKYKPTTEIANKTKGDFLEGKLFLQVEKIGELNPIVKKYAAELGVNIVESSTEIFKILRL